MEQSQRKQYVVCLFYLIISVVTVRVYFDQIFFVFRISFPFLQNFLQDPEL
jgi:hypothetical protein